MDLKYNRNQRREYLFMTESIGVHWVEVFEGNSEFYNASYWDLFTRLWKADGPVRKTDASKFMVNIKSAQTAGKFVDTAIRYGFIIERENPEDARSRLLELSNDMRQRLDLFFDKAVANLVDSARRVQTFHSESPGS